MALWTSFCSSELSSRDPNALINATITGIFVVLQPWAGPSEPKTVTLDELTGLTATSIGPGRSRCKTSNEAIAFGASSVVVSAEAVEELGAGGGFFVAVLTC
jgi:hypothetical protein